VENHSKLELFSVLYFMATTEWVEFNVPLHR